MWAEDLGLSSRSPLRFDRMPDRTQHSSREEPGDCCSLPRRAAPLLAWGGAGDARRGPVPRRTVRRDLLMEDVMDLLGRAVIYALALLGLLHVLGLVATA